MRKRNLVLLFSILVVILLLFYMFFNPVLLYFPDENVKHPENTYVKGDTMNPLREFDFESGGYTAYIILKEKVDVVDMPFGTVFKTKDKDLLKQLQQNVSFCYTGGDMATVENEFLLFEKDSLVFRTGIVLDEHSQGFQSMHFGWIEANGKNTLSKYCKQFSVCFPVIVFAG